MLDGELIPKNLRLTLRMFPVNANIKHTFQKRTGTDPELIQYQAYFSETHRDGPRATPRLNWFVREKTFPSGVWSLARRGSADAPRRQIPHQRRRVRQPRHQTCPVGREVQAVAVGLVGV